MSDSAFWIAFLAWGAIGFLIARLLARHWYKVHRRWLTAVSEREAGRSLEGRNFAVRIYYELVGSTRRGFGNRMLQPDPDPDIERLRLESVSEHRRLRPRFIGFGVCWLGGFLLLTTVLL